MKAGGEGDPGTGKTVMLMSLLRAVFQNPDLFGDDVAQERHWSRSDALSDYDARFWQTRTGRIYAFVRIDGGTDSRSDLECKIRDARHNNANHTMVLLDEAGELYRRELEESLRPLLTAGTITTLATAQNYHTKRRTDTPEEADARLRAFLRRFPHRLRTENPTPEELLRHLVSLMKRWHVGLDHPSTLRLLVQKSGAVVGHAIRPLIVAIDEPHRMLTRKLVESYDPDPLNG